MSKNTGPDALLAELGIVEPADIRIEAIAQYCGATVVYEPLTGCEAYIAGHGNRAIITVNSRSAVNCARSLWSSSSVNQRVRGL